MDNRSLNNLIIPGWMVFDLHLNYSELRVYALIYGFSQGGQGDFHGSLQYLADRCGLATRGNALRVLKALQDKGLVRKISGKELSAQGKVTTHNHYQAIVPDELFTVGISEKS